MIRPRFYTHNHLPVIAIAIFILFALAIAYQPVMFNFLCSDDFYIVVWLNQCKQNIAHLFQTVYEGTPYYRPVLNLLLFLEYLLCGANGVYFRLVSLSYLLITALILWLLVDAFANEVHDEKISTEMPENSKRAKINWCLFSVGFFLLFPLHTEPINWFVSTTELLANIFILASFLFFIYWRNKGLFHFKFISYLLAACAFLTKEIAVVLPAILFIYELLVQGEGQSKRIEARRAAIIDQGVQIPRLTMFARKLFNSIKITTGYWFLLIIYLCLRKIMTGNFLGNWSDVVFHFSDNQMMVKAWWQSIKIILSPISSIAFGKNIPLHIAWTLMLVDLAFLTLGSAYKNKKKCFLLLFFISWFFICLAPMAKLLLITPDLLDARYGYIASVPLCILLMFGLAFRNRPTGLSSMRYLIFIVILSFCCFVLRLNNSVWAEAGKLTNNMLSGFRVIHKQIPSQTKIYFINIPVKYNGVAIAGLKSIDSMNHEPFAESNYDNNIWLLDEDQSLPIGLMSHDLQSGKINARFYYLNTVDQHFYPVNFLGSKAANYKRDLGAPKVIPARESIFVFSPAELKCQSYDAVVFKLNIKRHGRAFKDSLVKFTFTNNVKLLNNKEECIFAPLLAKEGEQTLVIPLRGKPIWALGGFCHSIAVFFPKDFAVEMKNAYATSIAGDMPTILFKSENYDNQVGQLNLDSRHPDSIINYDASFISNCAGIVVQVIDSSEYFKELNSTSSDMHSLIDLRLMKANGQIKLNRQLFKGTGYYKVRLIPIDKSGNQCAFCSDHFILHISD